MDEWRENFLVCGAILAESLRGCVERTFEEQRSAVVKRVREFSGWIDEFEAVFLERQLTEEGR